MGQDLEEPSVETEGLTLWEAPGQAAGQREGLGDPEGRPPGQETGLFFPPWGSGQDPAHARAVGPVGAEGGRRGTLDELFVIWALKCTTGDSP